VLLGNIPDKDRAAVFYPPGTDYTAELTDPKGQIGLWWSEDEFRAFAMDSGWRAAIERMPDDVFNSNYRFDVILTRA
jgi:hypothetical protein